MGGPEKWSVTYTKHIKQKRKVFQDGFLELDVLSHKVYTNAISTMQIVYDSKLFVKFSMEDAVVWASILSENMNRN